MEGVFREVDWRRNEGKGGGSSSGSGERIREGNGSVGKKRYGIEERGGGGDREERVSDGHANGESVGGRQQ